MKFLILFGSAIILAHYTDQQLVLLRPGKKPHVENSHELLQLDPSVREEPDEISREKQRGDDPSADPDALSLFEETEEEDDESSESSVNEAKNPEDEGMLLILQYANNAKGHQKFGNQDKMRHWNKWVQEIAAGNKGDIIGSIPHSYQPNEYPDFNRRFVPVYPYKEEPQNVLVAPDNKEIIPIPAPLDVVTRVAKESALKEAAKAAAQDKTEDLMRSKILRSGDYWNALWVEKVEPKAALRSPENDQMLGTIKAKVKPGSEFYDVVANMTKISPKLLYIINEKKDS